MGENDGGQAGSNERHGPTVQDYYHVLVRMWEIQGNWFWQLWHYFLIANSFLFFSSLWARSSPQAVHKGCALLQSSPAVVPFYA